ncbi:MAG: aldehyde ferredoxin oxidoreductase family protein [Candidatus Bathyarchaeia archaeon]
MRFQDYGAASISWIVDIMYGWGGRILKVDLSRSKSIVERLDGVDALNFIGGRGLAVKLLWDNLPPGVDPLSPENILVFSVGPLTGLPIPSSGKLVVAAKSPLTLGYGDGSIGSNAAVQLRRTGFDAVMVKGKAERPCILLVEEGGAEILDAEGVWGLETSRVEEKLKEEHGGDAGVLSIGPAGERLIRYANVVSQGGRAGGRPGIGAVMGSKMLKAVVVKGGGSPKLSDPEALKRLGSEAYKEILDKPNYRFWMRQGTMATIAWSQSHGVLPSFNFREGVFEGADGIGGDFMESIKISQRGCPNCNMICGNIVRDSAGMEVELDYENVAMLGSNIGLGDLRKVAYLNRLADGYGLDTISLGNAVGFAMESSEKGVIEEEVEWGDFQAVESLIDDIVEKRGIGSVLGLGVRKASEIIGSESWTWAMHVKGLEVSAYDCHSTPGMALAYGTSPIGAHHKDAWVIAWEVTQGGEGYGEEKVDKVIELQRIRGGLFESLTTCRLPWVEVELSLDWYPRFFESATGVRLSLEGMYTVSDRIYSLIRAFWVRELAQGWSHKLDIPPPRWFRDPPSKGPTRDSKLDYQRYLEMLQLYYRKRGWDTEGIPTKATLTRLGLEYAASS